MSDSFFFKQKRTLLSFLEISKNGEHNTDYR